jgi:hypothetical protein
MGLLLRLGLLLASLSLASCGQSASVNYEIAIELDDHGTLRRGSGVWQLELREAFPGPYSSALYGDAIAIDLPGRGTIYAILMAKERRNGGPSDEMGMLPERLFLDRLPARKPGGSRTDNVREIAALTGATARLECGNPAVSIDAPAKTCPFLVRFRDPTDPSTVEAVDPEDISESFDGVNLASITVTITQDPVTRGIDQRLPWVREYENKNLEGVSGVRTFRSLAGMLTGGSFSVRERKR